jgi:hypothetical protein
MKLYYGQKLTALFDVEMEKQYPKDSPPINKNQCLKAKTDFVQLQYEQESDEVKNIVEAKHTKLYNEAIRKWECEYHMLHSPEGIKR